MQATEQAHIEFHSGNTMIYTLNNLLCDPDTFFEVLSYVTLQKYPRTRWDLHS